MLAKSFNDILEKTDKNNFYYNPNQMEYFTSGQVLPVCKYQVLLTTVRKLLSGSTNCMSYSH